jgi:hypothetical protein
MGSAAATLRDREQAALLKLLHHYYGLIVSGQASKLEEIGKMLGRNDLPQLKRNLDEYVKEYKSQLEGKV